MNDDRPVLDSPDAIRHHLDRHLGGGSFAGHCLRIVLCDEGNRVLLHCEVSDLPLGLSDADCARALAPFAHLMGCGAGGAVLLALVRPGPARLTGPDGQWFRVAHQVCAEFEVRLLGVHVATPHGQREVVLDDAL